MIWMLISIEIYEYYEAQNYSHAESERMNLDNFINYFNLEPHDESRSDLHKVILLVYFALTTLSSVGFGDFHPKSDLGRMVFCIIMVVGVLIFGIIMGELLSISEQFGELDKVLEEGDALNSFFRMIKQYNYGYDMDLDKQRKIEKYFDYYWSANKNQAIDEKEEISMLN